MPLVDYSTDDEEEEITSKPNESRKRKVSDLGGKDQKFGLPSLPESFHDLYATTARGGVTDDPSLHQGRTRAIPHVEGNWPSHVYIEWRPDSKDAQILDAIVTGLCRQDKNGAETTGVSSLLRTSLGADAPLHISLSRTLSLKTDQRQSFLDHLTLALHEDKIKPFDTCPVSLEWVSNYEGNRWFLILQLDPPPEDSLSKLLHSCNQVCRTYSQPSLYENEPIEASNRSKRIKTRSTKRAGKSDSPTRDRRNPFHISIAWRSLEPQEALTKRTYDAWEPRLATMKISVACVKVKIGNEIHSVALASRLRSHQSVTDL